MIEKCISRCFSRTYLSLPYPDKLVKSVSVFPCESSNPEGSMHVLPWPWVVTQYLQPNLTWPKVINNEKLPLPLFTIFKISWCLFSTRQFERKCQWFIIEGDCHILELFYIDWNYLLLKLELGAKTTLSETPFKSITKFKKLKSYKKCLP